MVGVTFEMSKTMFFDPKKFDKPVKNGIRKILSGFGAYTRSIAKNSIKTGADGQHSEPGATPIGHTGKTRYKDFIFYFFDPNTEEVIVGAVILPRKDRTIVPGALERGGETEIYLRGGKTKTVTMEARPHMLPAYEKAVEKLLPKLIENSIVKE